MKKLGNWWIPDIDNPEKLPSVLTEEFQCASGLDKAYKYVNKFENALDVGTWIGDSTFLMSKKFKNLKGFEPNKDVYDCCIANLQEKNILNCEMFNIGLSNKSGNQILLNKAKSFSGWISTVELSDEEKARGIIVNTCRLDDLNLTDIDFIKIDVDSHEGFLVDGAREFFRTNSPVIMIENKIRSHVRQDSAMPDPVAILESLNYKMVEQVGKADFIFIKQ